MRSLGTISSRGWTHVYWFGACLWQQVGVCSWHWRNMSPRALWHRGIRCVFGLFVGFQHSSVQKNAIKTSSHKQRMRLILQNVHSLAYTSERSLWILEEKQLLTVIGLEIWNKLLVIGNLSCQRGKDRILKYSSSNYHPGKFPTFPRVPCGRHAALKISKMFDEMFADLTFCDPDLLELAQILKELCKNDI